MQQRLYKGTLSPEALADYLVNYFDPKHDIQAQKLGKGDTFIVQIGAGDEIEKIHNAVSVTITKGELDSGLTVTMGEQRWFTTKMAASAAFWSIIALLVTPWALLMLLWPLQDALAGSVMPEEIWAQIDLGVASQGGSLIEARSLKHPHES